MNNSITNLFRYFDDFFFGVDNKTSPGLHYYEIEQ